MVLRAHKDGAFELNAGLAELQIIVLHDSGCFRSWQELSNASQSRRKGGSSWDIASQARSPCSCFQLFFTKSGLFYVVVNQVALMKIMNEKLEPPTSALGALHQPHAKAVRGLALDRSMGSTAHPRAVHFWK